MRHPLSILGSAGLPEGSVPIGDVDVLVVEHLLGEAVSLCQPDHALAIMRV